MNGLLINQILSFYVITIIYEYSVYLVMCHSFPLKTSKRKAYLSAFLCSNFLTITSVLSNIFIGGQIIEETEEVLLITKLTSITGELIIIIFIMKIIDIVWYRIYWITIVLHIILTLPFYIYIDQFFRVGQDYGMTITKLTIELVPKYLLIVMLGIIWGFLLCKICKFILKFSHVDRILSSFWVILYTLWSLVILLTEKSYSYTSDETSDIVIGIDNYSEMMLTVALIIIVIVLSINYSDKRLLKVENLLLKEQNEIQYSNYLMMQQQELEIHKLYHDIGNHIKTIQILVENREDQEAEDYTKKLAQQYQNIRKDFYSNHKIINAVLTQKLRLCDQCDIIYDIDIRLPDKISLQDVDLMCVYSNLLDNAIEGCKRNENENNYIKLKTSIIGNYFALKVINSKSREQSSVKEKNRFITWKKDKSIHGYGLRIIDEIVNRYDGKKDIQDSGEEFSALVMLKIQ